MIITYLGKEGMLAVPQYVLSSCQQ